MEASLQSREERSSDKRERRMIYSCYFEWNMSSFVKILLIWTVHVLQNHGNVILCDIKNHISSASFHDMIAINQICKMAIKALRWKPWKWTKVLKLSVYMIGLGALFIITTHCYLNTVKRRMKRHLMRSVVVLILRFVVLRAYWVHFVACLYFGLAMIWPDPKDTWLGSVTMDSNKTYNFNKEAVWKNYGICFYYTMSAITTLGYGDIHAVNILEMYVTPIILLSNMVVMTYIGSHFIVPLLARIFQDFIRYITGK
ncbi:potassium channel AKT2/3-like isoform X2 [Ziziphus jujuba]|uniref:Potassium channel AKT2/3-like isoform X2 n=1 Tax=Ziziphus jujuba TaxID=326968 RepID=A0ABM4A8U9_ZIZJJ|nr:potassium channel AKT2/3-like isoform X2 [Ziziphus jujuba]